MVFVFLTTTPGIMPIILIPTTSQATPVAPLAVSSYVPAKTNILSALFGVHSAIAASIVVLAFAQVVPSELSPDFDT